MTLFKQCKAYIQMCKDLEHYETDQWAVQRILDVEGIIGHVVDPCVGSGILIKETRKRGIKSFWSDIRYWGYKNTRIGNFLYPSAEHEEWLRKRIEGNTVFINPPFKYATEFIEKAFYYGAAKVICFQRHAWRESNDRREFWERYKPHMIWLCGSRATCWRHDIPKNKRKSSASTAHSWYVFYPKNPPDTIERILYKT